MPGGARRRGRVAWREWGEAVMLHSEYAHPRTGKRKQIRQAVRIAIEREIAESRSAQRRLLDAIKRSNQSLDTLVQELQTEGNQDAVAPAASRHAGQL